MTAADIFIASLRRHGVEWIATLCGHGLDPLFRAARAGGIRLIDTRNEQTAAYIAEAYGRLTGRPGVCAVSSGVAHINALTGVSNAWFDHSPMLLISGAGATATAGRGHFQDMDQARIAAPLCKFSRSLDAPERMLAAVEEALNAAVQSPRGPVHLTLPMDVQLAEVTEGSPAPASTPGETGSADELAVALRDAKAPLVIAGSGVFYAGAGPAMLRFCEQHQIPVVTPIWDRGSVPSPSPVFLGVIGAATGGPELLADADCIVMAGAECDYRAGYLEPPAIRQDARVVRWPGTWPVFDGAGRWHQWMTECARRRDEFHAAVLRRAEERARAGMHALHVIRAIEAVLDTNPVLLIDGGSIGQWAHQLLCSNRYPGDWLTCGRSGVVGWGLGGAMAARLAFPDRPVILLSGDGAFTFNVADLESAARQNLHFVAIVADDQGWGITRVGHVRQFGEPIASSLGPIAFSVLARALGARGVKVSDHVSLARELQTALRRPQVTVIHVPITGGNPEA